MEKGNQSQARDRTKGKTSQKLGLKIIIVITTWRGSGKGDIREGGWEQKVAVKKTIKNDDHERDLVHRWIMENKYVQSNCFPGELLENPGASQFLELAGVGLEHKREVAYQQIGHSTDEMGPHI